jgi:hypothetical protein
MLGGEEKTSEGGATVERTDVDGDRGSLGDGGGLASIISPGGSGEEGDSGGRVVGLQSGGMNAEGMRGRRRLDRDIVMENGNWTQHNR